MSCFGFQSGPTSLNVDSSSCPLPCSISNAGRKPWDSLLAISFSTVRSCWRSCCVEVLQMPIKRLQNYICFACSTEIPAQPHNANPAPEPRMPSQRCIKKAGTHEAGMDKHKFVANRCTCTRRTAQKERHARTCAHKHTHTHKDTHTHIHTS